MKSSHFVDSGTNVMRAIRSTGKVATFLLMSALLCGAQGPIKIVHAFTGGTAGGWPVYVTLSQGRDGALYGAESFEGSVFRVTPGGQYSQPYTFSTSGIFNPLGGVTLGTDGNFYGTAQLGGDNNAGGLYRLTPSGTFTQVYSFPGFFTGSYPVLPPIQASDGNYYGTTVGVGVDGGEDGAVVYQYKPSDGSTSIIFQSVLFTGV